jgi:hypothetical protein
MTPLVVILFSFVVALFADSVLVRRELRLERAARVRAQRRCQMAADASDRPAGPYRTAPPPAGVAGPWATDPNWRPEYSIWLVEDGSWQAIAKDGGGALAESPQDALEDLLAREDDEGEVQPPAGERPRSRLDDIVGITITPVLPQHIRDTPGQPIVAHQTRWYETYQEVLRDFGPDSPEYRAAAYLFQQTGVAGVSIAQREGEAPVVTPNVRTVGYLGAAPPAPEPPREPWYVGDRLPTAAGEQLDDIGRVMSIRRRHGEDDIAYRARLTNELPF